MKTGHELKVMIQNLIFGILLFFFENITSGIQRFYICPDVPVDITRVFSLISDFLAESLETNKN